MSSFYHAQSKRVLIGILGSGFGALVGCSSGSPNEGSATDETQVTCEHPRTKEDPKINSSQNQAKASTDKHPAIVTARKSHFTGREEITRLTARTGSPFIVATEDLDQFTQWRELWSADPLQYLQLLCVPFKIQVNRETSGVWRANVDFFGISISSRPESFVFADLSSRDVSRIQTIPELRHKKPIYDHFFRRMNDWLGRDILASMNTVDTRQHEGRTLQESVLTAARSILEMREQDLLWNLRLRDDGRGSYLREAWSLQVERFPDHYVKDHWGKRNSTTLPDFPKWTEYGPVGRGTPNLEISVIPRDDNEGSDILINRLRVPLSMPFYDYETRTYLIPGLTTIHDRYTIQPSTDSPI